MDLISIGLSACLESAHCYYIVVRDLACQHEHLHGESGAGCSHVVLLFLLASLTSLIYPIFLQLQFAPVAHGMKAQTALSFAALGRLTSGCLLHEELNGEEHTMDRRQASTAVFIPIGKGDRFEAGAKAPQGIGSSPKDFDDDAALSVFSVAEVESAIKGLQKTYPDKIRFEPAAAKTHEGRDIHYGVVGGKEPRAFLTSGVHARERGGPDNVLYLVSDLLWADKQNTGLTYGNKKYDVSQVRKILDAGIAVIPAVNPDGINHDQTTDSCWRKNRRPMQGGSIGVDINRNFNIFREQRLFSPQAKLSQSADPKLDSYIGPQPVSEAESRSITDVFERVKSLSWYLDLHSALGQVLYSWGTDEAQVEDPTMNFANKAFDGQRGVPGDAYKEYMEPDDFAAQKAIAESMATAMNGAAQTKRYSAAETITLSPAMGSSDEAMSRYYNGTCGANRINALTFEFGWGNGRHGKPPGANNFQTICHNIFYPNATEYRDNVMHTSVGMLEFLLNAAGKAGEQKVKKCDNNDGPQSPSTQAPPGPGSAENSDAENSNVANSPTQNSPTQNSPTQNNPEESGLAQNDPTQSGDAANGPTENDPPQNSPAQNDPTQSGDAANGPTENDPPQNSPAQKGPTQNGPTMTPYQQCTPAASAADAACGPSDKSCKAMVTRKATDCILRANFVNVNATDLQAWIQKDFDMIRQTTGLQSAMDADKSLKTQLESKLDAAQKDLVENFGDFEFRARVEKHFKGFDDVPEVGLAKKKDTTLNVELPKAFSKAQKDILRTDMLHLIKTTSKGEPVWGIAKGKSGI
ncbi:zinc carboxypeptidase A 1 precursor [Cordyceps militaris CM01]|uniref:Zinc carboxypeptidase A 1 n=1 Tax=Cordyceps militaris (strain CM01) TaxID=983644 RepID=G3J9M6_CORMM|nr:zinc carboxypeptidase A 1 precursor [Cordyceps militaris CM01]EGX94152.1 zinc carboxypeptidase A 1 precursor [Cordyceps militaris CM01]